MYVKNNRLNEASLRCRLEPISKNVIKNQNPIKLLFKDVKYFDAQNLVIDSLIWEVDIDKKKGLSKFLDKAPETLEIWILCLDFRNFAMAGNFLIGEMTTTIIMTIIIVEMFFCRLLHLHLVLIFQTRQGSLHFQTFEVL